MNFMIVSQFIDEQRNNQNKNTDKSTSCHGEEYYSQEDNPRFDRHSLHIVLKGSVLGRLSSNQ